MLKKLTSTVVALCMSICIPFFATTAYADETTAEDSTPTEVTEEAVVEEEGENHTVAWSVVGGIAVIIVVALVVKGKHGTID